LDKKNQSLNIGIYNVSLNIEIQQNSEQNNNGNDQIPSSNSPQLSNNNNSQLPNNINFKIPNEGNFLFSNSINQIINEKDGPPSAPQFSNKSNAQYPFNDNNKQLLISKTKIIIIAMINTKKSIQLKVIFNI